MYKITTENVNVFVCVCVSVNVEVYVYGFVWDEGMELKNLTMKEINNVKDAEQLFTFRVTFSLPIQYTIQFNFGFMISVCFFSSSFFCININIQHLSYFLYCCLF